MAGGNRRKEFIYVFYLEKNKRFFVGFDACDVLFNEFSCTAFMLHNLLSCEFGFMLYYNPILSVEPLVVMIS
jgi:hypothetical protein